MAAPISVCMIVKDEEHQLKTCLDSVRPFVEEIVIVDTGSSDATVRIAREIADRVEVFTDCNDAEGRIQRFDVARNHSFSLATRPWVMWIDADDVLVGGNHLDPLIRRFDAERRGQPSLVMMSYEYSHDVHGRVDLLLERERLMTPKEHFEWRGWVHEVVCPKGGDVRQSTTAVKVVHRRRLSKKKPESGRNLRILEAQLAALGDGDPRHLYYLGQELGYAGRIDEAIKFLSKHIERSGWDDERYMAAQLIANHLMNRGEYEKAIDSAMKAILIHEDWGEAYFTVAKCSYFIAQRTNSIRWWERAARFARMGLDKPPTKTSLFVNPLERDLEIHRYLNLALSKIGDTKGAIISANQGLAIRPDDEQFLLNKRIYEEHEAIADFHKNLDRLVALGKITREVKAHILDAQEKNSVPGFKSNGVHRAPDLAHLDIVFYVGYSVEAWNPETFGKTGLGGSETAVVEMSKRLAARGHRIRVFGDCVPHEGGASIEGTFDGVEYLHYGKFKDVSCDVLVSSRRPQAIDAAGLSFSKAVLWVHDVHCGDQLTQDRAQRFDVIWTLSKWHKNYFATQYPFLKDLPGKLVTTRNGIDLRRFDSECKRDPRRAIYSSSPDRGLQLALEEWPKIRSEVPGAELHVFYGFENWEPFATEDQKKLIAYLRKLLTETEGVTFHGRQPQNVLAEEFLRSGVWAYPTWFSETSCITAMEAQAAGLRIVTSPIAALVETVGPRGTMIAGPWLTEDYRKLFVKAVAEAMLRPEDGEREMLKRYAQANFGWDGLADEWVSKFQKMLREEQLESEPEIPDYQAFA
jgi:glycosyltransferase involved in cell wall biosynthesis